MKKNDYKEPRMTKSASTLRVSLLAGSGDASGARTRADVDHIGAFNFKVDIGGITASESAAMD